MRKFRKSDLADPIVVIWMIGTAVIILAEIAGYLIPHDNNGVSSVVIRFGSIVPLGDFVFDKISKVEPIYVATRFSFTWGLDLLFSLGLFPFAFAAGIKDGSKPIRRIFSSQLFWWLLFSTVVVLSYVLFPNLSGQLDIPTRIIIYSDLLPS